MGVLEWTGFLRLLAAARKLEAAAAMEQAEVLKKVAARMTMLAKAGTAKKHRQKKVMRRVKLHWLL